MIVPYAMASTYLPVDDEVYDILYRLEAEGIIQSGLLTTKPLSYREVVRLISEAERNAEGRSIFIQNLVKSLKERFKDESDDVKYIKPVDLLYSRYVYADSDIQALYYNNDGDLYEKGSNLRVGFTSRAELGWLSFYINPEFRYSDADSDLIVKRVYGVLNFLGLELTAGKDSQWWGPGNHGAILVSNNAEPMTMLRLTNPQPVILPWIFKYLGPFRFVVFATRLEKERDVPEPYLWGMRVNFKPHPYVEVGLSRTALLGGKGRSESMKTWWRSFTGKGENEIGVQAGDQRAGGDIKLTIPSRLQPLQLYAEADGEDEAGGLPCKWAYLMGLYLPRILNLERIGFRAEYATTHVSGYQDVWYTHGIYGTRAYTYKGRIIGHHMGTDSEDIFLEASYLIPEKDGRISISYDREEHNLSGTVREKKNEANLKVSFKLMKDMGLSASYGYGRIENPGNVSAEDRKINVISSMISYTF